MIFKNGVNLPGAGLRQNSDKALFMNIDDIDLTLLKQEVVDWHEAANEHCDLLIEHADKKMDLQIGETFQCSTLEEQRAFKVGVLLAKAQFRDLPFRTEQEEDHD
ncbi:hypothetical protein [Xenorhabdus thailandensis]|uniref:hypothetical protein n=1 Tax=Xenorhabdus thailandensis TaxID=3136255 RepID=UPI0030F3A8C0